MPNASARLIAIALALSVLLHVWLLTASVPNWNKIQMPEQETISIRLTPPTPAPVAIAPVQAAPPAVTPPAVTPPPRHEPERTVHQPPPRVRAEPRIRPQVTTPITQPERPAPVIDTRPAQPPPKVAPPRETVQTIPQVRTPPAARPQRTPRTAPSRGGSVDMEQLRSQLSAVAGDDDAPQPKFSKGLIAYPSANCTGSCLSYARSLINRLNSLANANKPRMQNGEAFRFNVTATVGPDGSVRSVSVSNADGNPAAALARSQTQSVSMPPFPADMEARASSLRLTFGWYAAKGE